VLLHINDKFQSGEKNWVGIHLCIIRHGLLHDMKMYIGLVKIRYEGAAILNKWKEVGGNINGTYLCTRVLLLGNVTRMLICWSTNDILVIDLLLPLIIMM